MLVDCEGFRVSMAFVLGNAGAYLAPRFYLTTIMTRSFFVGWSVVSLLTLIYSSGWFNPRIMMRSPTRYEMKVTAILNSGHTWSEICVLAESNRLVWEMPTVDLFNLV
jgi:hypothetical protein